MKENELKLEDVMCGDWVDVRNNASPNTPHIEKITPSHFLRDERWYGIELTPEILEKNGFVKGSYVGGFYSHWCPFRIYIAEGVGFSVLFDDEIHFTCTYIHQLQHALRLCGIGKEIVL